MKRVLKDKAAKQTFGKRTKPDDQKPEKQSLYYLTRFSAGENFDWEIFAEQHDPCPECGRDGKVVLKWNLSMDRGCDNDCRDSCECGCSYTQKEEESIMCTDCVRGYLDCFDREIKK